MTWQIKNTEADGSIQLLKMYKAINQTQYDTSFFFIAIILGMHFVH